MQQHIVLLRAVNVSGKNLIKMADLKKHLSEYGYMDVLTYIQSGNIILSSKENPGEVKENIQRLINEKFSCNVEAIVVSREILERILDQNPFPVDYPPNKVFVTFFNKNITTDQILTLKDFEAGEEKFSIYESNLYFYLPEGAAKAKLSNNFFENKLKVKATSRNISTVQNLLKMS